MAFHIPFNQRRRNRATRPRPVYIGFDVPAARPKRKFNWWGFNGLLLSLASFVTAGFASPVSLIVSMVGLRKTKGPRKAAAAGTIFSMIGIALASAITIGLVSDYRAHQHRQANRMYQVQLKRNLAKLEPAMTEAVNELEEYREANGNLPDPIFGNMLTIKHVDPWGKELRFEDGLTKGLVRSAGPDQTFDTRDDITKGVEGELEAIGTPLNDTVGTASVDTSDDEPSTEIKGYSRH